MLEKEISMYTNDGRLIGSTELNEAPLRLMYEHMNK